LPENIFKPGEIQGSFTGLIRRQTTLTEHSRPLLWNGWRSLNMNGLKAIIKAYREDCGENFSRG